MQLLTDNGIFYTKISRFGATPLVFDSPHSGFEFPSDFDPAATREEIRTTWDGYVDELYTKVTDAGATLLAARFPRAYIDANRAANDIEPDLLDSPWPEPVELSEHAQRGMGLVRRVARPGVPMYRRRLTVEEVRHRIDTYHAPYRSTLDTIIDHVWRRHGVVWHFNCHSMKSQANAGPYRPDVVIGDRDGTTAPLELTTWIAEHFRSRGYRVMVNKPYRGADIVRSIGRPLQRRYSLQIEINRSGYMDEATGEKNENFDKWQADLTEFAHVVALRVCDELKRGCVT